MDYLQHAIIVLLVKNSLNIHMMREHMERDTATMWFRVGSTKKNSVIIGGNLQTASAAGENCYGCIKDNVTTTARG